MKSTEREDNMLAVSKKKLDTNDNIKFNKKELKDLESLGYL